MSLELITPELQTNEALKGFETTDDLAKSYLDLQGKVKTGSLDLLPEDMRNDETVKFYKDIPNAMKGLIETKKLVGTIRRPPTTSKDYKFSKLENLHAGLNWEQMDEAIRDIAFKNGVHQDQAEGIRRDIYSLLSNGLTQQDKSEEELFVKNDGALHQKLGAAYETKKAQVVRMLTKIGGPELVTRLGFDKKLGNVPPTIEAFAKLADVLSEDTIEHLGEGVAGGGEEGEEKDYLEMRKAIEINDKKHPLMNELDPKHLEAVDRYKKLSKAHFERIK
jgi:hypothetical protein